MCRKKIGVALLVGMMLTSFNVGVLADELNSNVIETSVGSLNNNSTHMEVQGGAISAKPITDNYKKISENNNLELYLDENNLAIKIKNKTTGYVWDSIWGEEEENLNQTWSAFAGSALTMEYMDSKGKIQKASIPTKKSKISVKTNKDGFKAAIDFKDLGIELELIVALEDDGIRVDIPAESVKEGKDKNKIQGLYVYPFLGATKNQEISGYMFVPDGSGALIRLERDNNVATEPYIKRIYGADYGVTGVQQNAGTTVNSEIISYPVFGVVHNVNENGVVAVIEKGAEYGEINAYPAGITTPFNWITSKFVFRESYFQPTNQKGEGFTVNQDVANSFDISVKYTLLSNEDANYVGMAKSYREHLAKEGVLTKNTGAKDIPLRVEFLASDYKKSLFGTDTVTTTTVEDMDEILADLEGNGITNLRTVVRGWNEGGATTGTLNHFPFEGEVGSKGQWKDFVEKYEGKNVSVYMHTDYVKGYDKTKGYSELKDSAQTIAEQLITDRNSNKPFNYLAPSSTEKFVEKEKKDFEKSNISSLAMDTMGANLYSNSNSKNLNTRSESIEIYNRTLESLDKNLALYSPNEYLWQNTDEYFNISMSSSNYLNTTDTVPFLQIVLKGYMNYYASPFNFFSNPTDAILSMVDLGTYPSFYLTKEDSVELLETGSNWLYTSKYDVWKDQIVEVYNILNDVLKQVEGETIEGRDMLAEGVVKITYSDNTEIYVNYNGNTFANENIQLEAKSFKVVGGR